MVKVKEDLTGKKFGRLTVLEQAEDYVQPNGEHVAMWLCKCDCGNTKITRGISLRFGLTKSCGCFDKETSAIQGKANHKTNRYDLSGEYGIGYTLKGEEFYFDLEDYDKIKDYCWWKNDGGYLISTRVNQKNLRMHRLIMNASKGEYVDHINHMKLDNRKYNLRLITNQENSWNSKLKNTNKSGVAGVGFRKDRNKWYASITYNYHKINLGHYDNFDDAVKARKEAEEKYFGEFSYDNSMKKGENK